MHPAVHVFRSDGVAIAKNQPNLSITDVLVCQHRGLVSFGSQTVERVWLLAPDAQWEALPRSAKKDAFAKLLSSKAILLISASPKPIKAVHAALLAGAKTSTDNDRGRPE